MENIVVFRYSGMGEFHFFFFPTMDTYNRKFQAKTNYKDKNTFTDLCKEKCK